MRGRRPNYAWDDLPHAAQVARFLRDVEKRPGNGCWEWASHRFKNGYGRLQLSCFKVKRYELTHRLAWKLLVGPIPDGLMVLHHCDNPPCVRPDHLFLGTARDNSHDMLRKGRQRPQRGEQSPRAKLTTAAVREIRQMVAAGALHREAAIRFGVSQKQITLIVNRVQWRHVP